MENQVKNLPLVLLILDGWGIAPPSRGNAFTGAKIPFYNNLLRNYQCLALAAAGEAVGLPWGEPGNSEVGHLNLGAGRIVYQEVLRINKSIEDGTFFANQALQETITHCRTHNSSLHLMGLLSDGGVHSHQDHLFALLELAARSALRRVFVHVFLDGRDTKFDSGLKYVAELERVMKRLGTGQIASISGRFYALDRDNHWDRIEPVYRALVKGEAPEFASAEKAILASYKEKVYDEEFVPCVIKQKEPTNSARVQPGDGLIFFNYRPDRARELTKAFVLPTFDKFNHPAVSNLFFVSLTEYEPNLPVRVAFTKDMIETPISRLWSEANWRQLHIAETEKYAHITYFFNGGRDIVWPGQENVIVPSLGALSYAAEPAMSAPAITAKVLASLKKNEHDCYVVNFANADMVGHTGQLRATALALSAVDECLATLAGAVAKRGGILVITADHGNAEEKVNLETGQIIKGHSANAVPCLLVADRFKLPAPRAEDFSPHVLPVVGVLADVAPTLLALYDMPPPPAMKARALI